MLPRLFHTLLVVCKSLYCVAVVTESTSTVCLVLLRVVKSWQFFIAVFLHCFILADAYTQELNSLHFLYLLVVRCCECLSLWKLLCDYQLNLTVSVLGLEQKRQLLTSTFKTVVLAGRNVSSDVVVLRLKSNLHTHSHTHTHTHNTQYTHTHTLS